MAGAPVYLLDAAHRCQHAMLMGGCGSLHLCKQLEEIHRQLDTIGLVVNTTDLPVAAGVSPDSELLQLFTHSNTDALLRRKMISSEIIAISGRCDLCLTGLDGSPRVGCSPLLTQPGCSPPLSRPQMGQGGGHKIHALLG
eukprot:scaffold84_cov388-Prasinococcus_capsulatus_cf.AAC.16